MSSPRLAALRAWCVARLVSPRLPLMLALLVLLLTLPALWVGLQVDDHFHRWMITDSDNRFDLHRHPLDLFAPIDGDPERTGRMIDSGLLPWWTYEGLRLAFWRPLSAATHWLDYQLWPTSPALMHLHSMLWYAAVVACAALVYRRIIGPTWIAGLAALFYAIDDGHGFAVGWVANRNALIAAAFGFLALYLHDRWRRDGWRPGAVLAPITLLVALLTGESALGAGAYFVAYALWLDAAKLRTRVLAFVPYAAVTLAWWLCYHELGYGAFGSELYVDPGQQPLTFLGLAAQRIPLLLMGQMGILPAEISYMMSARLLTAVSVIMTLVCVAVALVIWPLLRQSRTARFWATGMLLALPPVCSTLPADRLLFMSGLGFMGLVAEFTGYWYERRDKHAASGLWRQAAHVVVVAAIILNGVVAPLLMPVRTTSVRMIGEMAERLNQSLLDDERLAEQDVIVVNTPNAFYSTLLMPTRAARGEVLPRHIRLLALGSEALDIGRPDVHTLTIRAAGGLLQLPGAASSECPYRLRDFNDGHANRRLAGLFRGFEMPMQFGQEITLPGMTVRITEFTNDGRPAAASFRFDVPLEDESLRWLRGESGTYVPFTPPAVGEMCHLTPVTMMPGK
ncbi:MAG: hypothetical protein JXO22_08140 [Phycisphaerae bacterium]|nr:hypothetical protein [Phycisphaerae bacterium]